MSTSNRLYLIRDAIKAFSFNRVASELPDGLKLRFEPRVDGLELGITAVKEGIPNIDVYKLEQTYSLSNESLEYSNPGFAEVSSLIEDFFARVASLYEEYAAKETLRKAKEQEERNKKQAQIIAEHLKSLRTKVKQ